MGDDPPPDPVGAVQLPEPLRGDPRRQAVPMFEGTAYQAWWSIDAWLRLRDAKEVIYLEGAEDFDRVSVGDGAIAVQVRHTTETISLGTTKARDALENFWILVGREEGTRRVDFHYLTTSSVAMEQSADFDGLKGLEAWRAARTNAAIAQRLATYLCSVLSTGSSLRLFLETASTGELQEQLIQRFHWLTDQPDLDVLKRSVDDRIAAVLSARRRPVRLAANVRKHLQSRFWDVVVQRSQEARCLTYGDLQRQFEEATTAYLPVPVEEIPALLSVRPGLGLLHLLVQKVPRVPEPLLRRPALTSHLEHLVTQRKVVLITGTVHKGKTTLAQLAAAKLCPTAWWLTLTERGPDEIDNLFLALASQIDHDACPSLVIIDDLDLGEKTYRAYRDSLALVLHRAHSAGRSVVLTAQGATNDSSVVRDFCDVVVLEVTEFGAEETAALCAEEGCPENLTKLWATLAVAWTGGHPKLIQVRLQELARLGWPKPSNADLTSPPSGIVSARQIARQLLTESVAPEIAEFIYSVSECSVLIHRSVAIRLAESVDGLRNAGDIVDSLAGKWLERIGGEWFRATNLLRGAAAEIWSQERRKACHIRLHDAFLAKTPCEPAEAAALLFHAYLGGERGRIALTAMRLHLIKEEEAKREVDRQLLWLPWVALESSQSLTDDPVSDAVLRSLQFRVAVTLESGDVPRICERWQEGIHRIPYEDVKETMQAMLWISAAFAVSPLVPLTPRLDAILGLPRLPAKLQLPYAESTKAFFAARESIGELPESGSLAQVVLLCAIRVVRDLASFELLVDWLETKATQRIRQEFDEMLGWPLVQTLGAFVQTAWTGSHEQIADWQPWLALFQHVDEYARLCASPQLGREGAKATAIILTEYLDRSQEAIAVLDDASRAFGSSSVLLEQRANTRFQVQDDVSVMEIWDQLMSGQMPKASLDPFAYRRAGISAARLQLWEKAAQIFRSGASAVPFNSREPTKFGLMADAALALSHAGDQRLAAATLAEAVAQLAPEASEDGNPRWEAALRVASEICRIIEERAWMHGKGEPKVEAGQASSANLSVGKVEPGQAGRCEIARANVLHLAATMGIHVPSIATHLQVLRASKYFAVRWLASEASIAVAFETGAGPGFIEALLEFDRACADLSEKKRHAVSLLEADGGPDPNLVLRPERWLGLVVMGAVCSGTSLLSHAASWIDEASRGHQEGAHLISAMHQLRDGAARPTEELEATVRAGSNPAPLRCGAAARLLLESPPADIALNMQCFLLSAVIADGTVARQQLYNRHVARRFAASWRTLAQNQFQFVSPRATIPVLLGAVEEVEHGRGTLRTLLTAAQDATGKSVAAIIDKFH